MIHLPNILVKTTFNSKSKTQTIIYQQVQVRANGLEKMDPSRRSYGSRINLLLCQQLKSDMPYAAAAMPSVKYVETKKNVCGTNNPTC